MIRVRAGSRLHFGFFDLPGEPAWPGLDGAQTLPRYPWGGIGMMVEEPGIALAVRAADDWAASGPCAARALEFAQIISRHLRTGPVEIAVESCSHEHAGLGVGTQLALAVGAAVCRLRKTTLFPWDMARILGRGKRSCIGIHGFWHGGFLIEAPRPEGKLAPLVARHAFPADWPITLVIPRDIQGTHGPEEIAAFQKLRQESVTTAQTDALSRLVLLHMLPALVGRDLDTFGEALFDFNRRVGEMFRPWQGGVYSHPRVADIIAKLRAAGYQAVGQSSWGPAVFAIGEPGRADLASEDVSMFVTRGLNGLATVAG